MTIRPTIVPYRRDIFLSVNIKHCRQTVPIFLTSLAFRFQKILFRALSRQMTVYANFDFNHRSIGPMPPRRPRHEPSTRRNKPA